MNSNLAKHMRNETKHIHSQIDFQGSVQIALTWEANHPPMLCLASHQAQSSTSSAGFPSLLQSMDMVKDLRPVVMSRCPLVLYCVKKSMSILVAVDLEHTPLQFAMVPVLQPRPSA